LHSPIEVPVSQRRVFRISRNEQYFKIRSGRSPCVRDLPAIRAAGQADIGDEQNSRVAQGFKDEM
jgi:hypothetical protein